MTLVVIAVVSGALVVGALWGVLGRLPPRVEGFVVALAGGALIVSATLELVDPATATSPLWGVAVATLGGAVTFVALDSTLSRGVGAASGIGLLLAIVLDGIPENLAMGVALIDSTPTQVAALSGSILLSNLPEAAGGARAMVQDRSPRSVLLLWTVTAVVLALAAVAGNLLLADVPAAGLGLVKCFAAGAVVASLATEVFPTAFREDSYAAGIATALGFTLAIVLDQLG
ncbi:MAG: hypothetical protein WKF50_06130 [Nocardioides sp.]